MKIVIAAIVAALSMTNVFAETYECMSTVNPGEIYLSYGRPCPLGTAAKGRTRTILRADTQGQFFAIAHINGTPVRSQIDTGATNVTLNMEDARRIGVDLSGTQRSIARTANGPISVFLVTLSSVRVGDIELNNVPATVSEGGAKEQAFVLIGMSFLRHLEMQHTGNTLTLLRP